MTDVCRYILIDAVRLQTHSVTYTNNIYHKPASTIYPHNNLVLVYVLRGSFNLSSLACISVSCGSLRYIRIDVLMAFVRACSGTLHVHNLVYARKVF